MSQNRQERRSKAQAPQKAGAPAILQKTLLFGFIAFFVGALIASVLSEFLHRGSMPPSSQRVSIVHTGLTLGHLLEMNPAELAKVDLAEMNLLCAKGLPGVADFDLAACLKRLDEWTDRVDTETRRNWHRFKDNPAEYHHSEVEYRMGMLITVLQQDLGVHYDPALIPFSKPGQQGRW